MANGFDSREDLAQTARKLNDTAEKLVVERAELQQSAVELAGWQAQTTSTVAQHERHLSEINGSMASMDAKLDGIATAQAVQKVQLGAAAAVGSLLGGGLVSWVLGGGLG